MIQLRVEIPHVKALNPKRYELIIGDIFGTIDADHFLTSFDSFYQTFTFFFDEFNRFNKFNKTENSQQLVLRIISSLTHINLINNSSLFNLVMSPLDYARCHSHDMLVLPDANLGLFVCVGRPGHTAPGKYTDFIDCGAISVKYSILKRIKQEKILPECICITNENDFLHTAKPYEFGKNESLFTKPCIYKNENRFGQSLLVKNEPTFYSHREFIPEYSSRQNRRITDTLHVVSCLEESTSSAESKSRFQPFEIYVYEDGLNLFLNEFYHDRNQTKPASSVHVSHMTPPYFSADFKLYIRFLPIIRNLTRCTSAILDRNISIEWPVRHSAVHSDLAHESSGKSNRRKSLWPFDTRKKSSALIDEEKQSGRYKFSIGQLNPEYKLKPSKHESMLSDKRLRVEEVFVESVIDDVRRVNEDDSQDEFEAMSVEFPNNDLASNQVVLFLSFVNWRITGCTSSMDISKV